ncbi:putative integral membrane protein [Theileria parva strain Muguga]|uniref:putative integral membrane protein n=1 Tax=Theileria parva strain Muguga TaxID=333668 RepID=UPI001C6241CA|nr:putative integral membrane protein [Theileria parva strain Muguga]EAN31309.2 putative integral membrane protein [Theileria parva strain Muguga]
MSSGLLTTLKYGLLTLGGLSTFAPYLNRRLRVNPSLLRPLLNMSWGYLFGSHLWELLSNSLQSKHNERTGDKKVEVLESDVFFLLAILGNSLVLITTFGLAPSFKKLQWCAYGSLLSTLTNYFLVYPNLNGNSELFIFRMVKPKTLSRLLLLTTLSTLLLYTVS